MKRTLIIIGSIIAIVVIVIFIFFEIKDVPDVEHGNSYGVEEKDTGGLFVFYKMLKERYGEKNTDYVLSDNFEFLKDKENTLVVTANKSIGIDSNSMTYIEDFIANGNEFLVISKSFNFKDNSWAHLLNTYTKTDTMFRLEWSDGESYVYEPSKINSFNPMGAYQSLSFFNYDENSALDTTASNEGILYFGDSNCIFKKVSIDSNAIHFHTVPEFFMNEATENRSYLTNFNKTFDAFENADIILHKFRRNNIHAGANKDSQIKYILSQRSLKYAYYLSILMCLVYVFFSSKRKQKEIPVIEESKNTSLEYISTMSAIFMAQNQNEKLVVHMKRNFFHKMKTSYFLNADDPNFSEKLSKKSQVPIDQINKIIKQFSWVGSYEFNDDQLNRLYNDVNSFYQIRK